MTEPRAQLDRDVVTAVGYLTFGAWAWFLYGFGALLPELGREQGLSRSETALHSVGLAIGAMIAGAVAVPLVRRLRRRGAFLLGAALGSLGVLLLAAGGSYTFITVPAAVVAGTGGSMLLNTAVSTLSARHHDLSAAALSEGNALATGVGLLAPLAVGLGIGLGVGWRPAILVVIPLVAVVALLVFRQPSGSAVLDEQLPVHSSASKAVLPLAFWLAIAIIICCVGVEFSMTSWTAELLRDRDGMASGPAAAGVSAVIGGMTLGRLITGRVALWLDPHTILAAALVLSVAGWVVAWLPSSPWLALPGLLITGTGMGAHYPVGASIVLGLSSGQRDRAAGVISIGIGIASGAGPFALGALADATSTHTAFVVVPGLLITALVLLPVSQRIDRLTRETYA